MNKCISCGAELAPQARFCGVCGVTQPGETNIETIVSKPLGENTPATIPPPPPQPQHNIGEMQNRGAEIPPPSQQENQLYNSPTERPHNPPSGPHPQPQASYSDYQQPQQSPQLQQPYSSYQPDPQPQPPYGNYQQPQPPYNPQPTPPPYEYQPPAPYYQQPQAPLGNYQPPPQSYSSPEQPPLQLGNYQQFQNTGSPTEVPPHMGTTGIPPVTTPPKPRQPAWLKWVLIGVAAVVVLAGSGLLVARLLVPPLMPTINVTSDYHDNGLPAGSSDTTLHVTGKQFANNSLITFLVDNTIVKQGMQAQSDGSGNVSTDLKVTSDWPIGQHKLTARDASGNTTNTGIAISIVQQGKAGTPGPNGAKTDDATFKINMELSMTGFTDTYELDINYQGKPVCAPGDDGSQQTSQGTLADGTVYTHTSSYTCSGTYEGGKVTYDDALDTSVYTDASGGRCSLNSTQPSYIHITGTATSSQEFSGNISLNAVAGNQYTCTGDLTYNGSSGASGTWTGSVGNLP